MALVLKYKERPEILVTLRKGDAEVTLPGYVDSGSDITYVPFQIARTLGLRMRSQKEPLNTGGGHKMDVVKASLDLIVCDEDLRKAYVFKDTRVFVPTRARDDELLLGREGFFDKFKVTINEKAKEIILERAE